MAMRIWSPSGPSALPSSLEPCDDAHAGGCISYRIACELRSYVYVGCACACFLVQMLLVFLYRCCLSIDREGHSIFSARCRVAHSLRRLAPLWERMPRCSIQDVESLVTLASRERSATDKLLDLCGDGERPENLRTAGSVQTLLVCPLSNS